MGISGVPTQEDIEKAAVGQRRQYDDGEYKTKVIRWFDDEAHTDDGEPIFIPSRGELTAFCRLLVDEDDGPPFSVVAGEVLALARAFGVEVGKKKWPDIEKDSSRFLAEVERVIEKADKEVTINVKGGWVSNVPGMSLPRDETFQLVYDGCSTLDEEGKPTWGDFGYGPTTILRFKVIGGLDGEPTPYNGYRQRVFVSYGLTVDPEDPTMPAFEKDEKGTTGAAVTCYNLILAMCPDLLENTSWGDPSNIMPEWDAAAKEAAIVLRGDTTWSKKAGDVRMYANTIKPRYKDQRSHQVEEVSEVEEEVIEQSSLIEQLYEVIKKEVKGKAFNKEGKLTDAGKKWAKKNLRPLLDAGKIEHNKFVDFTDEEVRTVLRETGHALDDLVEEDTDF